MSLMVVTSDDVTLIPRSRVKWMDERQLCPFVLDRIHAKDRSEDWRGCPALRQCVCTRAARLCAFIDQDAAPWIAGHDWKRRADGAVEYDPLGRLDHYARDGQVIACGSVSEQAR